MTPIQLRNARGEIKPWSEVAGLKMQPTKTTLGEVMRVHYIRQGDILFQPVQLELPTTRKTAQQFRPLALAVLAQFPELAFVPAAEGIVQVAKPLVL
ncbi:hypothetical protein PC129_g18811 [Phytophthora cactorum]|uniref:Uncharacterized protein n=1 Tax=Phytophthora cactorum TaxID=29920 RepID=A0A329SA14_9STRA|nr:hypothetical protein Pcac1_g12377 [Phytophthora cactorum]KAG2801578.1 hypothetical protein PC112_g19977 [Phytophthora cactorum]KAG2838030.1 hypothetical protein PC111_g4431 [Phytophthora cactorum]KAG2839908.1 hypothetical protein PC113_g19373 [Phytophthora cactorum]KAG2883091.1 hypothetical protein PC114_g20739 [Phytophthora cactorum]